MGKVIHGDCLEIIKTIKEDFIIVTDPPFNIGYHYKNFKDKKKTDTYYSDLVKLFLYRRFVCIHYPEQLHELSIRLGYGPEKVVSWVYNAHTSKQHRDIAFYTIKPDFSKVRQPYKNPNDKRILKKIKNGATGAKLYDWWNVDQVKNVSKEKTAHPCQTPLKIMENIIGILPKDILIIDPFAGSGTTGLACKNLNRNFILIEQDKEYIEIIKKRLSQKTLL